MSRNPLPAARGSSPVPWYRRMEARVAVGVSLIAALSLGVVLLATSRVVTQRSLSRASGELEAARRSCVRLLDSRAESAATLTRLITELPIFRVHLTDRQLAADATTLHAMVDRYRQQLGARFCIVTNGRGAWVGTAGWPDRERADALQPGVEQAAAGRPYRGVASIGDRLYMVVSEPAWFAQEVLGTMTVGFSLDDAVARELAAVTGYEVTLASESHVSGSSLPSHRVELLRALTGQRGEPAASRIRLRELGDRTYVQGTFPLAGAPPIDSRHRLVLLEDWAPTQQFIDELDHRILRAGLMTLGLALGGGLLFSRRISRPLATIAAATEDIASGNWDRQVPLSGGAETLAMAAAFNKMSASLRVAHDRLTHDALHDQLTSLPNRALFMERLRQAMSRRERHPESLFAVLFIDLDRFKTVNDSLGHPAGDELLLEVARRLTGVLRREDTVARHDAITEPHAGDLTLARLGGDEFTVLVDHIRDPSDAVRVAERLHESLARPIALAGQEVFTTASIGIAVSTSLHRSGDDVVRDADAAMYRAKAAGGDQCAVFDETMHHRAVTRLQLETDLRRALDRGEFRLFYQPIVSISNRRLVGFEALLRWQHPEQGLLLPGAFLDVALDAGLMTRIDYWVLDQACREACRWQKGREVPIAVSVNLSAPTFAQADVVQQVARALRVHGLDGRALKLELTEGVAMRDAERASSVLRDLREIRVGVSLDDFGTGYSSLSYLQRFPVDTLKVDRSFVNGLHDSDECRQIIGTVLNLARRLNLSVVAEGAETAEQVAYLESLHCSFAQGFFFSKPLEADQLDELLNRSERDVA